MRSLKKAVGLDARGQVRLVMTASSLAELCSTMTQEAKLIYVEIEC